MKADIKQLAVTNVGLAVVPRKDSDADDLWDIHLINFGAEPMENVLITSQGHGSIEGVDKSTTVLRHFHQRVEPLSAVKVEPIQPVLFGITNEYWVSFNRGEHMLDKKYIFRPGEIARKDLAEIGLIGKKGVLKR